MSFSQLGLNDRLLQGVAASGFTRPTPIQLRTIPVGLSGRDIVGLAQTGTGKTAAFVLPMLQRLDMSGKTRGTVRGLILTPTRELAQQVEDSISGVGRFMNFSSLSVYGGVSMENQLRRLRRGVDIIVATPGRLLDHLNRRTVDLSKVEVLVLDEADRMFDMGFINDVRKIISHVPDIRQTFLFSATMPDSIKQLTKSVLTKPEFIQIGLQTNPAETITQHFYKVPQTQKLDLLTHMLKTESMPSVLVFSRTRRGADRIGKKLMQRGFNVTAIHSDRTQSQRQNALAAFKSGRYQILVATDIAARGIDVEAISHVVNYDTPAYAEDYIHRIGRTGRAEITGDAITFVDGSERKYFKSIESLIGRRFDIHPYPGFTASFVPETIQQERKPDSVSDTRRRERNRLGVPEKGRNTRPGNRRPGKDNTNGTHSKTSRATNGSPARPKRRKPAGNSGGRAELRDEGVQQTEHTRQGGYDWRALIAAGEKMFKKVRGKNLEG